MRNNLCLLGIKEGAEGPRPTDFIAVFLQDLLQLGEKPSFDQAHRINRVKPQDGKPPRPFIVRVHSQTRDLILRRAREVSDSLKYQGARVSFYPDLTRAVAQKRAEFGEAKRLLRNIPGVKFGLARLHVSLSDGNERHFIDPVSATTFAKQLFATPK